MKLVKATAVQVGQTVYYIPKHLDVTPDNAETGIVSTVDENGIWVRYHSGSTGAKTDIENLYVLD